MTLIQRLLNPGPYTRPQIPLTEVSALIYHWVGNAGTNAEQNERYFNSLAEEGPRHGSYHYLVDLDGTVYQLIPDNEVAWHGGPAEKTKPGIATALPKLPNYCTIGISYCHEDWTGIPSLQVYESLLNIGLFLCEKYGIDPETRVYRHYDITGKDCPKYWADAHDDWRKFVMHLSKSVAYGNIGYPAEGGKLFDRRWTMTPRKKKGVASFVSGALFLIVGGFMLWATETPEWIGQALQIVGIVAEFLGFSLVYPDVD